MGGSSRKIRALAPLQGELSAQLTEGFRLGPGPSLAAGEKFGLYLYLSRYSAFGGGFSG